MALSYIIFFFYNKYITHDIFSLSLKAITTFLLVLTMFEATWTNQENGQIFENIV